MTKGTRRPTAILPAYSGLMFAALATAVQRFASSFMVRANSSAVLPIGSTPMAWKRSRISGSFTMRMSSFWSLRTMDVGVPAGATRPTQV